MSATRLSVLAFGLAVLALALLVVDHAILGVGPVSIGLQVLAALFMLWARFTFGMRSFHAAASTTSGELVTRGPYAIVRNPIYASVILFTWSGVAVHFSLVHAALGLLVTGGMLARAWIEERLLRERYSDYAAYAKRVKRWIPLVF